MEFTASLGPNGGESEAKENYTRGARGGGGTQSASHHSAGWRKQLGAKSGESWRSTNDPSYPYISIISTILGQFIVIFAGYVNRIIFLRYGSDSRAMNKVLDTSSHARNISLQERVWATCLCSWLLPHVLLKPQSLFIEFTA